MFSRSSGVLMHISSLPGDYGIGSFGKAAKDFIDMLHDSGCKHWQVLPFGTPDEFNSPYKSFSAFAGNPLFIDLEELCTEGLLEPSELAACRQTQPHYVDFKALQKPKYELLRLAFSRIDGKKRNEIVEFEKKNSRWLPDYALYMALREKHGGKDWYDWEDSSLRLFEKSAVAKAKNEMSEEILFQEFMQLEFSRQWADVREYAAENGVGIIGDMPIYVSLESSDVWSNRALFDLTEDGEPKLVSGVPPDYFSENGQKWGNPLYNWSLMKKDGYSWWMSRLERAFELYDSVRIDHFRGFSAYWAVPAEAETAKEGEWLEGPGEAFFDKLFEVFEEPSIIAEDLGIIDEGVVSLLKYTGLPCMRVMQFGFFGDDNQHMPHNFEHNCAAYTGTHDNNTLLGWLWELTSEQRERALHYFDCFDCDWGAGGSRSVSCRAIIKTLWQSCADLTVVPVQDLCGYGSDTRMNRPGVADGNWSYRLTREGLESIDRKWLKLLNTTYFR